MGLGFGFRALGSNHTFNVLSADPLRTKAPLWVRVQGLGLKLGSGARARVRDRFRG